MALEIRLNAAAAGHCEVGHFLLTTGALCFFLFPEFVMNQ